MTTENSLKKRIRTFSNFIVGIQFHLICQMLAIFSGVESEKTVSKLRKKKRQFVLCSSSGRVREDSCRSRATAATYKQA